MATIQNSPGARRARRSRFLRGGFRPFCEVLESRLAPANVDVLTWHNDNFLSGHNAREDALTLTNVNARDFGRLHTYAVDGYVYAQPLYKTNLVLPGRGTCNVVFVATQHDSVYAFDADNPTGSAGRCGGQYWQRSFINPAAGITTVPNGDIGSADIVPEIGITGTPVIDGATNTLYVAPKTKEQRGDGAHYVHTLHALDLVTGATRQSVVIGDSRGDGPHVTNIVLPGSGPGSAGGMVQFNSFRALQRPALSIQNGIVYVAWASHGDNGPYRGWVAGYRAWNGSPGSVQLAKWFITSRNFRGSGIWQSGGALAHDAQHNIYFAMGNAFGTNPHNPAAGDYTEAVLKVCSTVTTQCTSLPTNGLNVADYFTPFNWRQLDDADADLGSGGVMLLPNQPGPNPRLMVETGKEGKIYLINRDDLGQHTPPPGPDRVVQTLNQGVAGVWGNPAYFNQDPGGTNRGFIYYQGSGDELKAFRLENGRITVGPREGGSTLISNTAFGFPGAQPSISSNGVNNAIVWTLRVDGFGTSQPAVLYAHNAVTLGGELYRSNLTGTRDQMGGGVKFTVPTISNGKVIVGTQNGVSIFGLFQPATAVPLAPTNLAGVPVSDVRINLTWTNPTPGAGNAATGIKIERSLDGTNFTEVAHVARDQTSYADTGLQASTRYSYRIRATNQRGDSPYSNRIDTATRIAAPRLLAQDICSNQITITWNSVANNRYEIERSLNGTTYNRIATVPSSQTSYVDAGVTRGQFFYRVRAFNVNPDDTSLVTVQSAASNLGQGWPAR